MSRRSRRNNRTVGALTVGLLLGYLWYYGDTGHSPALLTLPTERELPDYYLINTSSHRYDENGALEVELLSEQVTHYPVPDEARLKQPFITLYNKGEPSWTVEADSGVVSDGGDTINFIQKVLIKSNDQLMSLRTPTMTVSPHRQIAYTDKPVTLVNPEGFTRAVGMQANLTSNSVTLLNDVKGQYHVQNKE